MKNFFLTNKQIRDLIDEPKNSKHLAGSLLHKMKSKPGREGLFRQNSLKFLRNKGDGEWFIYLRLSTENPLDFSCGLGLISKKHEPIFSLRRYNGKSHWHTNRLENEDAIYDFHIHQATEKYQKSFYGDDHYAQSTSRYASLPQAFECLLGDCKVIR